MTIPYSKCQAPEVFHNLKVFRLRILNLCTFNQNKETKGSNLELSANWETVFHCTETLGVCFILIWVSLFSSDRGFPQKTVRNIS